MAETRILVVDDDEFLADAVSTALRYEGFDTAVAGTRAEAVGAVQRYRPDLIVLDILLPDGSGLDLCRALRRSAQQVPVVFLTARDEPEERIAGLTIGGDDYLTKPFSLGELIARIRAVLRRSGSSGGPTPLVVAHLEIDVAAHQVRVGGQVVDLTPTEFELLHYLAVNAGTVLTKGQILDHVWQYDFGGNDGAVQTYISYLRRKVDTGHPRLIHTVQRIGYVLRPPEPTP
ncbi:response regulator transcription factor [Actinocrispum wychmicini]|uniref:response regulator transcription factor n=1 Tax=Actinocrispum wychmicini TaxID=1213861 RepID=UPI00104C1471|nr:response regulator transcription factor [Actinocrispum wychmicini]